jgi:hypothetical protein
LKKPPTPDFDSVPPGAPALVGSMRATGYDLETAVADIIDNSISAGARTVRIIVSEEGRSSWIAVADDGSGMDEATLLRAMTFGGINPSDPRDPDDLGRFGLGLKTASLSQCRRLTVLTRAPKGDVLVRCWDIDVIEATKQWALLRSARTPTLEQRFRKELQGQKSGTVVLWEVLDRLGHEDGEKEIASRLQRALPQLEQHLAMVFHRFLEEPGGLKIFIGPEQVKSWDPFMKGEKALQMLGEETLEYGGRSVTVRPYVLPHVSKLTGEAHKRGAGPRGWADQQGFYIYRNRRLLVAGSWLKLGFVKEEHNKLARIQLDFPNDLDFAWDINVRKSRAVPPDALRNDLKRIAKKTRSVATSIYRHRGSSVQREQEQQVYFWQKKVKHSKVFYEINRDHPAVATLLQKAAEGGIKSDVLQFLRVVEDTIPVPLILIDGSEQPENIGDLAGKKAPPGTAELLKSLHAGLCDAGQEPLPAFEHLAATEPFFRYPELLSAFREQEQIGG